MHTGIYYQISLAVAVAMIAVAGMLAYLMWELFQGSRFGRIMGLLASILWLFAGYHVALVALPRHAMTVEFVKSVILTAIATVVAVLIYNERQVEASRGESVR